MKKFRMMLPMLAFVFAMVGAVAGDFFSPIPAYYKLTSTSCSTTTQLTEQSNCQVSNDTNYLICTVLVSGVHKQAFNKPDCSETLRNIIQ
jgi:hypothetical protein